MSENFLANWMAYNRGTEAPADYFTWAGLSTLAALTGRKVWVNWGRYSFAPNLYLVLLGPAGNGKTSAMSETKRFIKLMQDIPYSAECQTKESLVKELATHEQAFKVGEQTRVHTPYNIYVTELSHFLGANSSHMIDFLTTIYDQDYYDTKTKNKGNDIINGPYINLLACTTPDWVTTYLKSDIISGGFSRRAIFVNEFESPTRVPFPQRTLEQDSLLPQLVAQAQRIRLVTGEFRFSESGRSFISDWYTTHVLPTDPTVRGFYRTKHMQVLKVAQLMSLSSSDELIITEDTLKITLALFARLERNLAKVFQGMGRNELNTVSAKLLDIVRMNEGVLPEKTIMGTMWKEANGQELFNVMSQLEKMDQIVRIKQKDGQGIERVFVCLPEVAQRIMLAQQQKV